MSGFPSPVQGVPLPVDLRVKLRDELLDQHPDVAESLENYAALLRETGRATEASKLETRAKAIRARHAKQNPAK